MIEVKKEEFYKIINPLDVCVHSVGDYPYTNEFKLRYGELIGVIKGGKTYEDKRYFMEEKFYNKFLNK